MARASNSLEIDFERHAMRQEFQEKVSPIRLMTVVEAAAEVGTSVATFRRLVRDGHGPVMTVIRRRRLIAMGDLVEWVASLKVPKAA